MAAKDPKDEEIKKPIPGRAASTRNRTSDPTKATPATRPAGQPPAKVPAAPANANGAPATRRTDAERAT
jgi:hypothetical protein